MGSKNRKKYINLVFFFLSFFFFFSFPAQIFNFLFFSHHHKNSVNGVEWGRSGNILATCSRDSNISLIDLRTLKEMQTFKGHKKEVTGKFSFFFFPPVFF